MNPVDSLQQGKINYYALIWIFASSVLAISCHADLDLFTESKTVPIVYCLLDADSSSQYVRVGQTFDYKGDKSILNEPGISYLEEEFDLYITYTNSEGDKRLVWFEPYDGCLRDSGLFPVEELQIMTAELSVELNTVYKLYLHLKESDYIVFGELTSFDRKFKVIDPLQANFRTINLYTGEDYYIRFDPVAPKAVYQSIMYFNYSEYTDEKRESKSLPFVLEMSYGDNMDQAFESQRLSGEHFLREVGNQLNSVEGMVRIATGFDFHIYAGGLELFNLINSAKQQFGFSASSTTNLDNGIGIFSSMSHKFVRNIPPSIHTVDSLAYSNFTKHLGFLPYSE